MVLRRSTSSFKFDSLSDINLLNTPSTTTSSQSEASLFARLILAPILFISFILSFFFIDKQTVSEIFGGKPEKDAYYHSHQRKLAKTEMDAAWSRKNRVIAVLCIGSAVGLALVAWGGLKAWEYLSKA
jgi:hypothetical protein